MVNVMKSSINFLNQDKLFWFLILFLCAIITWSLTFTLDKSINIESSNIFFQNNIGETLSIIQISKINLVYDKIKLLNKFSLIGEIFKIPFNFNLDKDLINNITKVGLVSKKLKIVLKNEENNNNEIFYGLNNLSILRSIA